MSELKPCPFCGGEAMYNKKIPAIICSKCKARIIGVKVFASCGGYEDLLAGFWNRRADND